MRTGGKVVLWVGGLMVVVLGAALVFLLTFDINRLRPTINEKVSTALGRPFAINGNLRIDWRQPPYETGWRRWVPWPRISAENISIANPDWATSKQFATLQGASAELSLLPLLDHHISIPSVQLVQPRVDIERLGDGRNNWTFTLPKSQGKSAWTLDLGTIAFDQGTLTLNDALMNLKGTVQIDPLGKPVPFSEVMAQQAGENSAGIGNGNTQSYVFGFKAEGSYNKAKVSGSGKIGGVVSLTTASQPLPLQVDASVGDTRITLAGTLTNPAHLAALDLHLKLASNSMAHLFPLTGIALPETPPFATAGHLRGTLAKGNSAFHYDQFSGHVGGSDLRGNLLFETKAPRPKLSGEMASNLLQFQDLAPLIGGKKASTDQAAADATPVKTQPADKVLPVSEFKTDRWAAMDADVKFSARKITREATLPIEDVSTHILLDDGVLNLSPLTLRTAGGNVTANLHLDGQKEPLQGTLDLQVRGLKLQQLLPNVPQMKSALGDLNGDMKLKAQGNSVAALAATSNGEMKLLVERGVISRNLLELAGLNFLNVVVGKVFGDKPVEINCAAANLVATNGQVDSRLFVVDTQDAQINVDGGINLATEKMDFDVNPHTKGMRILTLRSPLYVKGTFKKPDVGVDLGRMALKGGAAIGLGVLVTPVAALLPLVSPSHSDDNQCGKMITAMRAPSSAEAPGKAAKVVKAAQAAAKK